MWGNANKNWCIEWQCLEQIFQNDWGTNNFFSFTKSWVDKKSGTNSSFESKCKPRTTNTKKIKNNPWTPKVKTLRWGRALVCARVRALRPTASSRWTDPLPELFCWWASITQHAKHPNNKTILKNHVPWKICSSSNLFSLHTEKHSLRVTIKSRGANSCSFYTVPDDGNYRLIQQGVKTSDTSSYGLTPLCVALRNHNHLFHAKGREGVQREVEMCNDRANPSDAHVNTPENQGQW